MAFLTPVPRLTMLVAWTLAVTVAAGVASPRLRVAGRERVVRPGPTRSGSWRSDGARGWTVRGAALTGLVAVEGESTVEGWAAASSADAAVTAPRVGLTRPLFIVAAAFAAPGASLRPSSLPVRAGRAPPLA